MVYESMEWVAFTPASPKDADVKPTAVSTAFPAMFSIPRAPPEADTRLSE